MSPYSGSDRCVGPELEGAVCGSEIGSDLRIGYLEPFGLKHSLCVCVTVQEATQRGEEKGPRKGLNRSEWRCF